MTARADERRWAARAAARYDASYARKYRAHDDRIAGTPAYDQFAAWLDEVCRRFADRALDVLDLGCGTGRYFCVLGPVASLTGLDASDAMLAEARTPFRADEVTARTVALVRGDLVTHDFAAASFDLVYAIGVLAEHAPLDRRLVERVVRWLRPGGRFAFTTVHPESPSVPRTRPRRVAGAVASRLPAAWARPLRRRLMIGGLYADERWIHDVLTADFAVESLTRLVSEAHLHCLCVARKVSA